jgi:diguanylate cyclase (GGDEF)-like protein
VALNNLYLVVLEGLFYFGLMILLLHFRQWLGIGVFVTVLAAMHFFETYLATIFYVVVPFGTISPGSAVLFSGKIMLILLLYTKEDATTVRQLIYGLLIGNFLTLIFGLILRLHVVSPLPNSTIADIGFINTMGMLMLWGTCLLYLDSISIILVYEKLGKLLTRAVAPRLLISGMLILTFDEIGFFGVLHILTGAPAAVMFGTWFAKMGAVILFTGLAMGYQTILTTGKNKLQRGVSDIFGDLTYRERYHDLLDLSGKDGLTGLLNRRQLEDRGHDIIRKSVATEIPVSLMVVDCDHFKLINDRFGHLAGDNVLKQIAEHLLGNVRGNDHVFRFGGEEFVILAAGLTHDAAYDAANRIRHAIANRVVISEDHPVTVSIGVASAPADGTGLMELFSAADARLYKAKGNGRNIVIGAQTAHAAV